MSVVIIGYTITEQRKGRYIQVGKELYKKGCVNTVEDALKVQYCIYSKKPSINAFQPCVPCLHYT